MTTSRTSTFRTGSPGKSAIWSGSPPTAGAIFTIPLWKSITATAKLPRRIFPTSSCRRSLKTSCRHISPCSTRSPSRATMRFARKAKSRLSRQSSQRTSPGRAVYSSPSLTSQTWNRWNSYLLTVYPGRVSPPPTITFLTRTSRWMLSPP